MPDDIINHKRQKKFAK